MSRLFRWHIALVAFCVGLTSAGCVDEEGAPCGDDACVTPPLPECERSLVVAFQPFGTCEQGECRWERSLTPCPYGCVDGACLDASVVCESACSSPPSAYCDDATLVFFGRGGLCDGVTRECRYSESRADCTQSDRICAFDNQGIAACREQGEACNDGALSEGESDIDCGGVCLPCSAGAACAVDSHCQSRRCLSGRCAAASCGDLVRNGLETDVDCGGGECSLCEGGLGCNTDLDCATGICVRGACAPFSCINETLDGLETGLDCGGVCDPCEDSSPCAQSTDCISGVCLDASCAEPSCEDRVRNGLETGVDCGGDCGPC